MTSMMRTLVGSLTLAAASAYASGAGAIEVCGSNSDTGCWRQVTYTNFKDFSVGGGLVCMVGGNSQPASTSDQYKNPNNYSENLGNEDIIECHKPDGASGISSEPFWPGYGSNPNVGSRVPGGVYDHGSWGGTPTGVIAMFGSNGDDVAVLNSKQYTYVAIGDRFNFKTGGNYQNWVLDRKNIRSDTGATICLKGLWGHWPPMSGPYHYLQALGCDGDVYAAVDAPNRGWLPTYKLYDANSVNTKIYGLTSDNRVRRLGYREDRLLPTLPSGTPKAVGGRFVISTTSNRIYAYDDATSAWQWQDVGYPESQDPSSSLGQIDSGWYFRGNVGEFFAWQSFHRVYLYVP